MFHCWVVSLYMVLRGFLMWFIHLLVLTVVYWISGLLILGVVSIGWFGLNHIRVYIHSKGI